jgi:cell division protein FtsI (penicillin-binding protein 3)
LKRQLIAQQAGHGSAIVMEVETGRILAIANLKREANGDYSESYNYAVGEASEPGSTFKLASMIVALEDGVVDTSDMIRTGNGVRKFANRYMRDSHHGGYGTISVVECFEKSSNVGISSIIYDNYRNDPDRFVNGLYDLGLNKKLGIEIKGEGTPLIRNTEMEGWSKVSLPWMSIGYEVALTPLQILTFYNGIANDGVMMKPQFITSIKKSGQIIESYPPEVLNDEMCSQSTIDKVKKMMEGVVEHGTASNLNTSIYKIAGKTGTAQLAQGATGYNKKDYKASFVGYFPAENPKYSCIISINEPSRGVYYGNRVSGVAFKEIADRLYATRLDILEYEQEPVMAELDGLYYQKGKRDELYSVMAAVNIPVYCDDGESEWVVSMPDEGEVVKLSEVRVKEDLVPNVKGMSVKDAVYLLEKAGMIASFNGRGHVKSQSIKAGTRVKKGMKITLKLV